MARSCALPFAIARRISLRFLAEKQVLVWLFILYCLLRLVASLFGASSPAGGAAPPAPAPYSPQRSHHHHHHHHHQHQQHHHSQQRYYYADQDAAQVCAPRHVRPLHHVRPAPRSCGAMISGAVLATAPMERECCLCRVGMVCVQAYQGYVEQEQLQQQQVPFQEEAEVVQQLAAAVLQPAVEAVVGAWAGGGGGGAVGQEPPALEGGAGE